VKIIIKYLSNKTFERGTIMASTCPNCGKKLHIWNVKAECSACGVSIPNYNWQARLEEDNVRAEKQFAVFNKAINRIAYSIWGTKLRIARLVLSFIPIIGFLLPWATLKSDSTNFDLSIISFSGNKALTDFFSSFFGNMGLYSDNMKFENYGGAVTLGVAGYILFTLSILFIVIAFLLNIIMCKHPKTKSTVVFDVLSVVASVASVVCFVISGNVAEQFTAYNFGDFAVINGSASISWGYFVALILLIVATGINIAVAKAPAKSDETLEEERLARKAVKDEKERQKQIEREKSRELAEKAAAEEEAKKVEEAKAKLAAKANKGKK
jgi:ribosomal protein L37E